MQAMNALPTTIRFERDTLQLGTIRYGEKRKVTFRFTNTGQTPLLLRDVRPSCGCTGAEWEKRPVAPGETGEIKITFAPNSLGHFLKNIDIVCNIDSGIIFRPKEDWVVFENTPEIVRTFIEKMIVHEK